MNARGGFAIIDLLIGLGIFVIAGSLFAAVLLNTERQRVQAMDALTQSYGSNLTSNVLKNTLAAADLRTYTFSSDTNTAVAYRFFLPLHNRDARLAPASETTSWLISNNGAFRARSLPALCSTQRLGRWFALVPLWDRGEGAVTVQADTASLAPEHSNSLQTGTTWGILREQYSYLLKLKGVHRDLRWSQDIESGDITLATGDASLFAQFPTECLGGDKIKSTGQTATQKPLYPELQGLDQFWMAFELEPLVLPGLIQDQTESQPLTPTERVLSQLGGRLGEIKIQALGISGENTFEVNNCRTDSSQALGLRCDDSVLSFKGVDRIHVKLRTQINAYPSIETDNEPIRDFLISSGSDLPNALSGECPESQCRVLSTLSSYSHRLEGEKPTRYLASAFSTLKLESLQQAFFYLTKGGRLVHRAQVEFSR
jgi:hypothetical protein